MAALRINLFGQSRVDVAGYPASRHLTFTVQNLLAYLLLHRTRSHRREVLVTTFWPDRDESHARACFKAVLWRLRQVLEPAGVQRGTYLITTPCGQVGFNCNSDYWLDVAIFEEMAELSLVDEDNGLSRAQAVRIEKGVALYRGDVLEGVYSDWAIRERERLRSLYLDALYALIMQFGRLGDHRKAMRYCEQILAEDPLREEVHRQLMIFFMAAGDRPRAVRQYSVCRQILSKELGICPMEETTALVRAIESGEQMEELSQQASPRRTRRHAHILRLRDSIDQMHLNWVRAGASIAQVRQLAQMLETTVTGDPSSK